MLGIMYLLATVLTGSFRELNISKLLFSPEGASSYVFVNSPFGFTQGIDNTFKNRVVKFLEVPTESSLLAHDARSVLGDNTIDSHSEVLYGHIQEVERHIIVAQNFKIVLEALMNNLNDLSYGCILALHGIESLELKNRDGGSI